MSWSPYAAGHPTVEGWHVVHHSIPAHPDDTSYWKSMAYKALYWHPDLEIWTENARRPDEGGKKVEIDVLMWFELNTLGAATA